MKKLIRLLGLIILLFFIVVVGVRATSTTLFEVRNSNKQRVFSIKEDEGRTSIDVYPSLEEDRTKLSFRSSPFGKVYRPLSIETHGFGDTSDPNHKHVTFYSDTTERFKKLFQWEWGLDFEDNPELEIFATLYPSNGYNQLYNLGKSNRPWNKTYTDILHLNPGEKPINPEVGDIYLSTNFYLEVYTPLGWEKL